MQSGCMRKKRLRLGCGEYRVDTRGMKNSVALSRDRSSNLSLWMKDYWDLRDPSLMDLSQGRRRTELEHVL